MLQNKNIVLGICGSIAAYKSAFLTRLLIKAGANVRVVMTKSGTDFISPLTLATLSKNEVLVDFTNAHKTDWHNHVELGLWADMMVIAPASANTLAKMAGGICDNLLLAVYLSAKCPVYLAPAMDLDMYRHPATTKNLEKLALYGNHIIAAEFGELASGLEGEGRMAEPEEIIRMLDELPDESKKKLKDKRVLITAGPTHEAIDPVRYIGNHSSGKMGIALAEAFVKEGAEVILVKGPTRVSTANPEIRIIEVTTAAEMLESCLSEFDQADITVSAAAVADYTPETYTKSKIKKGDSDIAIRLIKTADILATLGKRKKPNQTLVGFALETDNELENAKKKLESKNLDMIVLNSMNDAGATFEHDSNKITIVDKEENISNFDLKPKSKVAEDIVTYIIDHCL